jgi:hypothetical protein
MWPYTNDEAAWLAAIEVPERSGPRGLDPHSLFALELAARRYRAQMIARLLRDAALGLWRFALRMPRRRKPKADGLLVRLG